MKKENKLKYAINLMFILYFVILIIERVVSLFLSIKNGINIFGNGFNIFVYSTIFISIIGFIIYMSIKCRFCIKALFVINDESIEKINFSSLVVASGILLLSGMVHSEYTYLIIQFISYGFLIVGIILQTILNQRYADNKIILWLSTIFLVFYSMAIPVVYKLNLDYSTIFHVFEGITTYLLVGMFTYMTICLFNNKNNLFNYFYIIPATFLDIIIISMRWQEVKNIFLLVFLVLSVIVFVIGKIIVLIDNKNMHNISLD